MSQSCELTLRLPADLHARPAGQMVQAVTHIAPGLNILLGLTFIVSFAGVTAPIAYLLGGVICLLVAIVLTQRAFPDHLHFSALLIQFALGFNRPGIDRFPKLMRGPLGNHRNGIAVCGKSSCRGQGKSSAPKDGPPG